MNVWPRAVIPGVPLLSGDDESIWNTLQAWVQLVLNVHRGRGKGRNVPFEPDLTHKIREPGPNRLAVKFAQERGVMEPNPTAFALLDVSLEGRHGLGLPAV